MNRWRLIETRQPLIKTPVSVATHTESLAIQLLDINRREYFCCLCLAVSATMLLLSRISKAPGLYEVFWIVDEIEALRAQHIGFLINRVAVL